MPQIAHMLRHWWLPRRQTVQGRRASSRRPVRLQLRTFEDRLVPSTMAPQIHIAPTSGTLPLGAPSAPGGGYTPADVRHAYGFDQIQFNGITGDGTGQTIAIVDAYDEPNIASDLAKFDAQFGLPAPPSFTKVNQTGGTSFPASNQSWGLEIALDVEWAHAMAPGAKILLVECTTNNWSDLIAGVDYARSQAGVSVISMSWGGSEWSTESSYDHFSTPTGRQGITFVASSGDSGSSGAPLFPSISPHVLAVGGTALTLDSNANYVSESGWSSSGGGISQYQTQPSYQKGVVTQSSTMRTGPDVAYVGASSTTLGVYDTSGYGGWVAAYGTSAGAPQWAALIAIADQGRALAGQGSLDGFSQTLPKLYQLPTSDFHDITTGSNGGYSAGAGYDLVTGRGSPVANLIASGLIDPVTSSPPTVATPASATPTPVTGKTTSLSVLGSSSAGESTLTYTWTVTSMPSGVTAPSFSLNGANAAKNTTATFSAAGTYTFQVRITDSSGLSTTSSVTVTVNQTLSGVRLTPGTANVNDGSGLQFTASAVDQFGNAMSSQPGWTWTLASGMGSITSSGMYSAPATGTGSATIQASGAGMVGSASVTINAPVTLPAAPSNLVATGGSNQIQLTWQDNSTNESGFTIQVLNNGGKWSTLAQVGANVTSYTYTGVGKHKSFSFRVCAFNSAGSSAYSNVATASSLAEPAGAGKDGDSGAPAVALVWSNGLAPALANPGLAGQALGVYTTAGPGQAGQANGSGSALGGGAGQGSAPLSLSQVNNGADMPATVAGAGQAGLAWDALNSPIAGPSDALWWMPMG